jgi:hypothetical protein
VIDQATVAQQILQAFTPHVPLIGGFVIAFMLIITLLVFLRDRILTYQRLIP